jgi:hypothetical protein
MSARTVCGVIQGILWAADDGAEIGENERRRRVLPPRQCRYISSDGKGRINVRKARA